MLTDIGRRDEDFRKRNGVIGQEEHAKQVLSLGVGIDDLRDVHNESDGLEPWS